MPSPRLLVALSATCVVAVAAIYLVAMGTATGREVDDAGMLRGFEGERLSRVYAATDAVVETIDYGSLAVFGAAIVGIGLARRRLDLSLGTIAILAGANVTTQILKPLLGELDALEGESFRVIAAAYPSGHATVAMSLGLSLVLVSPRAWRPSVALVGAGYATAVGVGLIALAAHYPSDVAGGYFVATAWAAAVVATLAACHRLRWSILTDRRPPSRLATASAVALALTVTGALAALAIAGIRRGFDLVWYGRAHTTFFLAAVIIAAIALVLSLVFARFLHRTGGWQPDIESAGSRSL